MPLLQIANRERLIPLPSLDPLRRREFWATYCWETPDFANGDHPLGAYPPLDAGPLAWELPRHRFLILQIGHKDMTQCDLVLHDASEEGAPERSHTLGFENVARPYPHALRALRWDELDLLGRYVAAADRDQPHPSWPVLFLARFALPTTTFPSARAEEVARAAWRWLGSFTEEEIAPYVHINGNLRDGFAGFWHQLKEGGWALRPNGVQPPYSLRSEGNAELPFSPFHAAFTDMAAALAGPRPPSEIRFG